MIQKTYEETHWLESRDDKKIFKVNLYYLEKYYPQDKLYQFEFIASPVDASEKYKIAKIEFGGFEDKDCSFYINDFRLPEEMRSYRVGQFIFNKFYNLLPTKVVPYISVSGTLFHSDFSIPRRKFFKKIISYGHDKNAQYNESTECGCGKFEGKLHDVGQSWLEKIIDVTESD